MFYHILSCYTIVIVLFIVKSVVASRVCTRYSGCFIGKPMSAYGSDIIFDAYLGVPYSKRVPRFELPLLYTGTDQKDCTKPAPDCINKNYLVPTYPVNGAEDCLYLNIYTNSAKTKILYPVIVYLFGGGFFTGSANPIMSGPEYLMDRDKVVVVTVNYRLGAFGFLTTSDGVIPGNLGLKDQLCALRWIQDNIAFFGGNKFKVTLLGHGSGAVGAHLLVLSPHSKGLFQNVIAMSGTANSPYAIDDNPEYTARRTARYCNIPNADTINTTVLRDELKKVNVYELLDAGDRLKYWDVDHLFNYRPVVEWNDYASILPNNPLETLRTGNYTPVPILFGRVPNEGGIRAVAILESEFLRTEFNKDFYNLLVEFLGLRAKFNHDQIIEKMEYILDAYFNNVQELNKVTAGGFVDLISDWLFHHPQYNAINMIVNSIDTEQYPIYIYEFDYQGPYTYADYYNGNITKLDYGVTHSDDLIYMLRSPILFKDFPVSSNNARTIKYFTDDIVTFAVEGKPKKANILRPCDLENFVSRISHTCEFEYYEKQPDGSLLVKIIREFHTQRMTFWDFIMEGKRDVC